MSSLSVSFDLFFWEKQMLRECNGGGVASAFVTENIAYNQSDDDDDDRRRKTTVSTIM